jgi:hypothetical protein
VRACFKNGWPLIFVFAAPLFAGTGFAAWKTVIALEGNEAGGLRLPVGVSYRLDVRVDGADGLRRHIGYYDASGVESHMVWRVIPAKDRSNVASIDEEGTVTALAAGQAQIEVAYLGQQATMTLTVFDEVPTSVEISPGYQTIDRGSQLQFDVQARFGSGWTWDMKRRVVWTATNVGPGTQVASIDPTGQVRGVGVGVAEIAATVSGKRAATQLMVVEPARDSPQRPRAQKLTLTAVYRLCRARMQRLWVPKLRELAGAPIELRGEVDPDHNSAHLGIDVRGAPGQGTEVSWALDRCEGADRWWDSLFKARGPITPLEKMLTFASNDCLEYPVQRMP